MGVTSETIGEMQLDGLVEGVQAVYGGTDAKRTIWDVWMHANHHASGIAEEVRKGGGGRLLEQIADCAMWLFTLLKKLQGPIGSQKPGEQSLQESLLRIPSGFSDMLWKKFPGICPSCYWRRTRGVRQREQEPRFADPCDCLSYDAERRDPEQKRIHANSLRAFSQENGNRQPAGVDAWQKMFGRIFAANLERDELSEITLHLLEEMGEVSDALVRMYTYTNANFSAGEPSWRQIRLEQALADVSSWVFAIVEKLDSARLRSGGYADSLHGDEVVDNKPILLSQIIWRRYGSDERQGFVCPYCHGPTCNCPVVLVPPDRTIEDVRRLSEVGNDGR